MVAVRNKVHMISPYGQVIEDCIKLLNDQNTMLLFIKRLANMTAHEFTSIEILFLLLQKML